MQLKRAEPPQRLISLVSMVDVLLIMLVFFMVTSTYLNLDMIPMAQRSDDAVAPSTAVPAEATAPMMIRLGGDGRVYVRGRATGLGDLGELMQARMNTAPDTPVLVLPSARAHTQALVSLMDVLTNAGVTQLRIVQLEVAQ